LCRAPGSWHHSTESRYVCIDHHCDKVREIHGGSPAEDALCPRRVGLEQIDFGGPAQVRIKNDIASPIETDVAKCALDKFADAVPLPGADDVIFRSVLLQHQPHGADVIAGETPIAFRFQVAEPEFGG